MENIKELLFNDTTSSMREVEGMRMLCQAAQELKNAFDKLKLNIPFGRDLFLNLVNNGTNCLLDTTRKSIAARAEKTAAPPSLSFNFQPDFNELQAPLNKIKEVIQSHELDPYSLKFTDETHVFPKQDETEICDRHKYFAEGEEQIKYWNLVKNYCQASNKLDQYARMQGDPCLYNNLISSNASFYVDFDESEEEVKLTPNYRMFIELANLKKRKK